MNISQAILYIHPTLEFGIDFTVEDHSDGEGPQLTWIAETPTEPTQQELDDAWALCSAEITKQADIEAFDIKDEYIDAIERKIARLEVRILVPGCSQENIDMMQVIIDNLTTESVAKETEIDTLLTAMKSAHGVGVATDYANRIKARLGNT